VGWDFVDDTISIDDALAQIDQEINDAITPSNAPGRFLFPKAGRGCLSCLRLHAWHPLPATVMIPEK
jgi:hypothetical protein